MTTETSPIRREQWHAAGTWRGGTALGLAAVRHRLGQVRIIAAARAGLFRSDDGGATWAAAWQGIADPSVLAVTAAGVAQTGWPALYAATETGRLYRSDDGGATWNEVAAWAGLGVATVLVASPTFADDGMLFAGTAEGVFRTLDGGQSWESSAFGLVDVDVLCLAVAPDFADSHLVWTGTAGGGLYRSRNQARAWRESGLGLPDAPVQVLVAAPTFAQDRTLYAGMEAHGIYRSSDGGETWAACGPALAGHSVNALLCLEDGSGLVAATDQGLYVSDDRGDSWQTASGAHPAVLAFAAAGDLVVAGAFGDGLFVSHDRGRSWQPVLSPPLHVPPLVVTAGETWAALDVDGGLAASQDGGATWEPLAPPEVEAIYALAADETNLERPLLAATSAGVWWLDLPKGEWRPDAAAGLPQEEILGIAVAANGGARLAYTGGGLLYASRGEYDPWQEITGPWRGQTLLRALPVQDEDGSLRGLALTIELNEQGHYAIHLWLYRAGAWLHLADLAADIPAMQVAWPDANNLWLATQHRIVRLHQKPLDQTWEADQYFFTPGQQITALHVVPGRADVWLATTQGIYRSRGPETPWTRLGDLPDQQPLVFLRVQGDTLQVISLGGQAWRTHVIA